MRVLINKGAIILLLVSLFACSEDDGGNDKSTVDQGEFLKNSSEIISESWENIEVSAVDFETLAITFKNTPNGSLSLNQIQGLKEPASTNMASLAKGKYL